jgi:cobalamin biosynthesis protein CbiD
MRSNVGSKEQKIRMAVGSAAGAAAVFAPLRLKWKGVLSAVAVDGLITGLTGKSPAKWLIRGR